MTNNKEFADFLRGLADFYETRPNIPQPLWLAGEQEIRCYFLAGEDAKEAFRSLGSFTKEVTDEYFSAKKIIGGRTVVFMANREKVCTAKVVGKRTIPAHVIPAKFEPEQVIEECEEEIVEWDCEPVLAKSAGETITELTDRVLRAQ